VTGPGGSDSAQGNITVNTPPQAPVAQFSANPTSGNAPLAVQFTDQSTGNISSYSWSFGDSVGASTQQSPSYTYNNPGNYTVTLTVTGPGGSNSAQTVISVNALAAAPVAQFSANPTSGTSPLAVQFTDQSSGNITSYSWNFGDGVGASTQQSPSYVYNTPGTYTVTLTVTGPGGSNLAQTVISVDALPFDTPAP
jgi:PKD repeat protein